MCDSTVSEDPFLIVYCPDKYKTQGMCDEAVDDSVAVLKLISNWFPTSKTIKKLKTALYTDENILYFNEDSDNVVFHCNGVGIFNIDFISMNFDNNFDEDDPETIILIRVYVWHTEFKKQKSKTFKKNKRRINANSVAS